MVTRENKNVIGIILLNEIDVLVNSVCSALIPVGMLVSLIRRCREVDMKALSHKVLGKLNFTLEQVQDLTPTPMTLSSVMFYTGINPYTGEKVYVARSQTDKRKQKQYFFKQKSF